MENKIFNYGAALIGLCLLIAAESVRRTVDLVITPVVITVVIVGVIVAGGVGGAMAWMYFQDAEGRRLKNRLIKAQATKIEAEALSIRRQSAAAIIADAHQAVFKTAWSKDDQIIEVRRVDLPGIPTVNGVDVQMTPMQEQLLLRWHTLHSTAKPSKIEFAEPAMLPAGIPPVLPRLINAQRLIISGPSDAGKTTLVKHIIAGRSDHSSIVVIDPHAPSKILGYDCIGAGRDYLAIGNALESLIELMTERYDDVKKGVKNYQEHVRVSVFIDEWTSIAKQIKEAGDMLAILLVESRKVNIHLTICTHSITIETLKLPDAQIRKSATIIEMTGGDGTDRRCFVLPKEKTNPDGTKAIPAEHALPGPFAGYVQPVPKVVIDLPDAKTIKAQKMFESGASLTSIAKEMFGVTKPNGIQINQVKEMLDRAKLAQNGYDKLTT